MTREEFYQHIESFIMGMLPEAYAGMTPVIQNAKNQGGNYTGLMLHGEDASGIAPIFNLDILYDRYKELDEVEMLMAVANDIEQIYQEKEQIMQGLYDETIRNVDDYEYAKSRLFISPASLIRQREGGVEPCKRFVDLCMQVRIKFGEYWENNNLLVASSLVTDSILERWGKSFDEVFQDAMENTPKLSPVVIQPIQDLLEGIMGEEIDIPEEYQLLVVRNTLENHGAASLFLPGIMDEVADMIQGSYIVIPSSVHEFIIQPVFGEITMGDIAELEGMIREVNETLEPDEILSDRAYFYNATTKVFGLAEDELALVKGNSLTSVAGHISMENPIASQEEAVQNIISGVYGPQN